MAKDPNIITLHRYFDWADRMRKRFEEKLIESGSGEDIGEDLEYLIDMSYWFAGMYVVIEGWKELGLNDSKIDKLLTSSNLDLLRRYRNAVFHYQKDYYSEKFRELMEEGDDSIQWVKDVTNAFSAYFLNYAA